MRILVTGSTGTIGSRVVRELAQRVSDVRALTRSPEQARAPDGARGTVEYAKGDLEDPPSLRAALDGVDRMFLLTPLHPQEAELGKAAVGAAGEAGVKKLVIMTVHHADQAPQVPHFASKVRIREAAQASGIPFVEIAPNSFYQNDLWLREALMDGGVYPNPVGDVGLSRVDANDIAHAVANALVQDIQVDGPVPLVGPDALTGADMAATWAKHLGRPIQYLGDVDAWAAGAAAMMPEWMVEDLVLMLRHFIDHGLVASEEDLRKQGLVLHRDPKSFDDFVAGVAAQWTGAS